MSDLTEAEIAKIKKIVKDVLEEYLVVAYIRPTIESPGYYQSIGILMTRDELTKRNLEEAKRPPLTEEERGKLMLELFTPHELERKDPK